MSRSFSVFILALVSYFPVFWLITFITGNNDIGGWAAVILCFLLLPVTAFITRHRLSSKTRCPDGKGLYPECLYVVKISDSEIANTRPDGVIERIQLKDLKEVVVLTNSLGPWGADVWWHLIGKDADSRCVFPGGATGEEDAIKYLQQLPGFDNGTLIKAMGSTSEGKFVCWNAGMVMGGKS